MTPKTPPVICIPVGQLHSNCYIYKISSSAAIIIDPGDDDQYIIENLQKSELTPVAILATHGHFDHLLAGFSLQAAFNIPFYMHDADTFLLARMRQTAIHFKEADPGPEPIVTKFFDNNTRELVVLDSTIKIIHTAGHTPGSVSFYHKQNEVVFVGDLMFSDGSIGEVTHAYSNRTDIKKSIQKILTLPTNTMVYSGHGEESTVGELQTKFKWALV